MYSRHVAARFNSAARSSPSSHAHRVPMNLVAALVVLGSLLKSGVPLDEKLSVVLSILAGLTGAATLIQVKQFERSLIFYPTLGTCK